MRPSRDRQDSSFPPENNIVLLCRNALWSPQPSFFSSFYRSHWLNYWALVGTEKLKLGERKTSRKKWMLRPHHVQERVLWVLWVYSAEYSVEEVPHGCKVNRKILISFKIDELEIIPVSSKAGLWKPFEMQCFGKSNENGVVHKACLGGSPDQEEISTMQVQYGIWLEEPCVDSVLHQSLNLGKELRRKRRKW